LFKLDLIVTYKNCTQITLATKWAATYLSADHYNSGQIYGGY